jgi:beta-lactam-binding protein with PASTA domain
VTPPRWILAIAPPAGGPTVDSIAVDVTLADPLVGTVLEGRYRVAGVLARGGMSTVYTGTDLRLDRTVAIKVMSPALAESPAFVQKFTREARSAARLSHMNVVSVYDQGADAGHVFLIMELVRGRTLRDLLLAGPVQPALAVTICEAVLSALAAAHRAGLVHRDVKPENVLLSSDGVVKVADFGLARAVASASSTTQTGVVMGTVAYVAPEQVTRGSADARSDVYSAGIMLYELLTGTPPYAGDTAISVAYRHVHDDVPPPSRANPRVPPALDELVVRATRREPGARPADAGAFLAELHNVRTDLGLPRAAIPPFAGPTGPPSDPHGLRAAGPGLDATTQRGWGPAAHTTPTTALPGAGPLHPGQHPGQQPGARPGAPVHRIGQAPPVYTEQRDHRRRHRIGLAIVLVLGLLAATAGWWYGAGRWSTVPKVNGMAQQAAIDTLRGSGLSVSLATGPVYDDDAPPDTAARTDPPIGSRATHGTRIVLFMSKGPAPRVVPQVNGVPRDKARADLESRGLVVTPSLAYDENVPNGSAVRTDPPAGTSVSRGARVTLVVSGGPAPRMVPDLTGRPRADAVATLSGLKLRITEAEDEFSDDVPAGAVIRTDPAAGKRVSRGSTVQIVLSRGPEKVPVPSVIGKPLAQAKRQLEAAGFVVVVKSLFGQNDGNVLGQTPLPLTRAKRGTTVTIGVL